MPYFGELLDDMRQRRSEGAADSIWSCAVSPDHVSSLFLCRWRWLLFGTAWDEENHTGFLQRIRGGSFFKRLGESLRPALRRASTVAQIAGADAYKGTYRDRNGVRLGVDRDAVEDTEKSVKNVFKSRGSSSLSVSPQVAGALVYVLGDVLGDEWASVPLLVPALLDFPSRLGHAEEARRKARTKLEAQRRKLESLGELGTAPLYLPGVRKELDALATAERELAEAERSLAELRRAYRRFTCYRFRYASKPDPTDFASIRAEGRFAGQVSLGGARIQFEAADKLKLGYELRVADFEEKSAHPWIQDETYRVVQIGGTGEDSWVEVAGGRALPTIVLKDCTLIWSEQVEVELSPETPLTLAVVDKDLVLKGGKPPKPSGAPVDFRRAGLSPGMAVTVHIQSATPLTLWVEDVDQNQVLLDPAHIAGVNSLTRALDESLSVHRLEGTKALPPELDTYTPYRTGSIVDVIGRQPIHLRWKDTGEKAPVRVVTNYDYAPLVGYLVDLAATEAEKGARSAAGAATRGASIGALDNEVVAEVVASLAAIAAKKFSEKLSYTILLKVIEDPEVLRGRIEVECFGRKESMTKARLFELLREHYLDKELEKWRKKHGARVN